MTVAKGNTSYPSALRERAAAVAEHLAAALAVPPDVDFGADTAPGSARWRDQSLSKGAAGVAVLHGLRARAQLADTAPVHAWLARATRDDLSVGTGAGLWFGAPAVAFALTVATPGRYPGAAARLHQAVTRLTADRLTAADQRMDAALRPSPYEFDLTRGLSGLGAYLLRADPGSGLLRRVLVYLVRLTHPIAARDTAGTRAPGWWTAEVPARCDDPAFADGHANLAMAHGIAGPLALLALAAREGVTVDGHHEAVDTICQHLDAWRQASPAGPWWPERITLDELDDGCPHQGGPNRPSWCYGTPGLARAQQLAALALGDTARQRAAEHALASCLADPVQLNRLTDPTLCHGWAGVTATAWHAAADADTPHLSHQVDHLIQRLLDHGHHTAPDALPGLIEGSAGVALTLHSIATAGTDGWTTCLLIG
ncbi:lanthionine synthetase C family protein [Kitasatospora sp. NPDC092286]|uniref:lanthionine synthetase C family protein n=1 Tax=Kitasatospora sp. NPDC092286 TaxID=3364087 RepID=UPI0038140CBB